MKGNGIRILERGVIVPWLASSVVMYGLSYVWHGVALRDLEELHIPIALYMSLAGLVYLVIGLGMTILVHKAVEYEWISLKRAFPLMSILCGAAVGFFVYLLLFVLGVSFTKNVAMHVVADALWQMIEQGLGGLVVSLGIIYDMRQHFLEEERAR